MTEAKTCKGCKKNLGGDMARAVYCFSCDALYCGACTAAMHVSDSEWRCPGCHAVMDIEASRLFKDA